MASIIESIFYLIDNGAKIGQIAVNAVKKLNEFGNMLLNIDYSKIPDKLRNIGETWGKYGWVPFLPTYSALEFYDISILPISQEDADQKMNQYLNDDCIKEIIKETKEFIDKYDGNSQTFDEAMKCYDNVLYTSCSLNLCALIDGAFLKFQKIPQKGYRPLSNVAIDEFIEKSEMQSFLISLSAIKSVVEDIFAFGHDFIVDDNEFKRNYVSHGMNKRIPTSTDCLKLMVVLYNVYLLFDADILHREDI